MVIRINLLEKSKPSIKINTGIGYIDCLIDTGADIPVWCSGGNKLKKYFADAEKTDLVTSIGGFGTGGSEKACVWKIPIIKLADKNGYDVLNVHNLLVAVITRSSIGYDLIFSATMFNKIEYGFNYTSKQAYCYFKTKRDGIYVLPIIVNENEYAGVNEKIADTQYAKDIKEALKQGKLLKMVSIFYQDKIKSDN